VSQLRTDLATMVEELLARTPAGGVIDLDTIGEAIGARAISQDEIDAVLATIEQRGRHVATPSGGQGEAILKTVLDAARVLQTELGRPPRADEIATRAGISREEVQHALSLARIMQR
jgi:2-hydroxychromene-2-carboxylate isomerase